MTREARSIRCPESILGWIPWYAEQDEAGVPLLDARQRGAVEAHASECADCRAELDMIAGAPYRIDVEIPDPDRVFDEITARIDAGEAEGRNTAPAPPQPVAVPARGGDRRLRREELERLEDWVFDEDETALGVDVDVAAPASSADRPHGNVVEGPWSRPGVRALAAAAVFVIGLALGGMLDGANPFSGDGSTPSGAYVSAAAPVAFGGEAPLIDVVFAEGRTIDEVATALRGVGGEIVSGPSSVGRYRVRLDPARLGVTDASARAAADGPRDIAAITARLKAGPQPIALFAEPVLR